MLSLPKNFLMKRFAAKAAGEALGWLTAQQEQFRISTNTKEHIPWRVKPVGELIFLLMVLKRHGISLRGADPLRDFARDQAASFDWQELAAFDPSAATVLAMIAEFFAQENRPEPFEMAYFHLLRDISFFEGMDRVPYREMDLAYCYSRIGIPDQQQKLNSWFENTAFGRRQNVARYTIDDLYSLTHAIFYLTDVGRKLPAGTLEPEVLVRLHRALVALTAIMMRADNADVLGELLICWIFSGLVPTPFEKTIFAAALQRMFAALTAEGAVAPTNVVKKRSDAGEATFGELYHTTLVGCLLFALVTRSKI